MFSGITGRGGRVPARDFPPGNFWRLIGKRVARKKDTKMENVEKKGKIEKGWRKMRKNEKNEKGKEKN